MARIPGRGTLLKVTISSVLTTVAQTKSINIGATASQVVDVEATDDTGVTITQLNIGTVAQEDVTAEIYYDPDSTVQQFITDTILAPAGFPVACSVVFADATPASVTFSACGFGFSVGAAVKDVLMGNITINCAGPVAWPS